MQSATLDEFSLGSIPGAAGSGVAVALRNAVATSTVPVSVTTGTGVGRKEPLSIEVEAAAYFTCLEAVQNAAKHARAGIVRVRLGSADGVLAAVHPGRRVGLRPLLRRSERAWATSEIGSSPWAAG